MKTEQTEYDVLSGTWQTNTGGVSVRFSMEQVEDPAETEKQGRPIFREVEYIEFSTGDKYNRPKRPILKEDIAAHRAQYNNWKAGNGPTKKAGMPLAQFPGITGSQVRELGYFEIHTVEELAGRPDSDASAMGALFPLRDKAREYIERSKNNTSMAQLEKRLKDLEAQNAALKAGAVQHDAKTDPHPAESKKKG